jgi:1,4-dihydroxy-2-naphthoate octaprenyltransferase
VTTLDLAVAAGLGLFAVALLEAVNLRASAPQVRDGRLTLMRLLGPRLGRWLFALCLLGAYAVIVEAALAERAPHGALAVLFALPATMVPLTGGLRARGADTLAGVVRGTLRAYTAFAFWLVMGLLLGTLYLRLLAVLGG